MAIFNFGHLQGVNWCKSWTKNIWAHPVSVKIQVLQNDLNGIRTTMGTNCSLQLNLTLLAGVNAPQTPQNEPNWVLNQKNAVVSSW